MTCWFFMSYARADDKLRESDLVRTFFDDLKGEVSSLVEDQSPPIASLDQEDLKPGDRWPEKIAEALCNCRTFIPVMTARYFKREYCGKEWGIFENRRKFFRAEKSPPLIIPVLWVRPEEGGIPEFATDIQMTFDPHSIAEEDRQKLEDYPEYGLWHVIKRKDNSHQNVYETILEQLARRIVQVATQNALPRLGSALPSLKDAFDFFQVSKGSTPALGLASSEAHFAFVAAKQDEMEAIRPNSRVYYGDSNEREWLPFAPEKAVQVALIAQSVATENELVCNWVPVGPDMVNKLKETEKNNAVAVVIVDPWTARLPKYQNYLNDFDQFQFRNCVVLIAWNKFDQKTQEEREQLHADLKQVLSRNFEGRKEAYFKPEIEEHNMLRKAVSRSLSDLQAILASYRKPARSLGQSKHKEPPPISVSEGGK